MNIKECYAAMNADFNEVLKRFGNENFSVELVSEAMGVTKLEPKINMNNAASTYANGEKKKDCISFL